MSGKSQVSQCAQDFILTTTSTFDDGDEYSEYDWEIVLARIWSHVQTKLLGHNFAGERILRTEGLPERLKGIPKSRVLLWLMFPGTLCEATAIALEKKIVDHFSHCQ
jgi:hypothetical protein